MKSFFAVLRAALRALKRMVWVTVEIGGKLVSMLVPAPENSPPQGGVEELPADTAEVADFTELKRAAGELAQCRRVPEGCAITDKQRRWLDAMPRLMLCRILCASNGAIERHLDGTAQMTGVIAFTEAAIEKFSGTKERERVEAKVRQRMEFESAVRAMEFAP